MIVYPTQNKVRARLRFRFKSITWTEEYMLGAGTPSSKRLTLEWLCRLRASWMGYPVSIDFASVSDLGSSRDAVAADGLPYTNGWATLNGIVNDVMVGYEYRLQRVTGEKEYRTFRGIPDSFITGLRAVGGAWVPNPPDATTGVIYDPLGLRGPMPPGPNRGIETAQSFLNFLVQQTSSVTQRPNVPDYLVNGPWDDVVFRRIAPRRSGNSFGRRAGRFSR